MREKKSGVGDFIFSTNREKCMILTKILHCADDTRKYAEDMHKDADNLSVSYNLWIWAKIVKKGGGVNSLKKWGGATVTVDLHFVLALGQKNKIKCYRNAK